MEPKKRAIKTGQAKCIVTSCRNIFREDKHVSFHEFPSEQKRHDKWVEALTGHVSDPLIITSVTRVCGAHFQSEMFTVRGKWRCLKKDAVPQIFRSAEAEEPYVKRWRQDETNGTEVCNLINDSSKTFSNRHCEDTNVAQENVDGIVNTLTADASNSNSSINSTVFENLDDDTCCDVVHQSKIPKQRTISATNKDRLEYLLKGAKIQTPKPKFTTGYERQRNRVRNLERQLSRTNRDLDLLKKNYEKYSKIDEKVLDKVLLIVEDSEKEYHKAQFLRDQILNYGTLPRQRSYHNTTIEYSVLWSTKSSGCYDMISSQDLLTLPSRKLLRLRSSTSNTTSEVDVITSLNRHRSRMELETIEEDDKLVSGLQLDEMQLNEPPSLTKIMIR